MRGVPRKVIASAALFVVVFALNVVPARADAASLTVTPSEGLLDGQGVTLTGTGFTGAAGGTIGLLECRTGPVSLDACDVGTLQFPSALVDGAFTETFRVHRSITVFDPAANTSELVSCDVAPGICMIAAAPAGAFDLSATVPISFDPNQPPPDPQVTVTPAEGLLDGQSVHVSGAGFLPGSVLTVQQCAVGAFQCNPGAVNPSAGTDGTFAIDLTVQLATVDRLDLTTTCLDRPCEVRVDDFFDREYSRAAPLAFDPAQPPPALPHLTVEPHVGLHDRDTVTLQGDGFPPGSFLDARVCLVGRSACTYLGLGMSADATGTFQVTTPVRREVLDYHEDDPVPVDTPDRVDCAPDHCEVRVLVFRPEFESFFGGARSPVAFDASAPLPDPPTMTVDPAVDVPYSATVVATGHGFTPGSSVSGTFCVGTATTGFCPTYASGVVASDGSVQMSIAVQRVIPGAGLDCLDPGTSCTIRLSSNDGLDAAEQPLAFDPTSPPPPPPAVTVTPDRDLGWRQAVAVTVTGLTANSLVGVQECQQGTLGGGFDFPCRGSFNPLYADAEGRITTTFELTRVVTNGFDPPIDCADSVGRCVIRVFSVGGFGSNDLAVPLGFDPSSQEPPGPTVVVDPADGLVDGQTVHVTGHDWSSNASIGAELCLPGATSLAACDPNTLQYTTTDAGGAFALDVTVHARIVTEQGAVDCTAAPGTCVLGVANTGDFVERAYAPLAFETPSRPELEVHSVSVEEGTGGVTAVSVPVDLSGPAPVAITLHW
ncbi:MAG: neocarzinostatin apoprotein domain-containing protein, partial [Acidimicrobiia bacterium]